MGPFRLERLPDLDAAGSQVVQFPLHPIQFVFLFGPVFVEAVLLLLNLGLEEGHFFFHFIEGFHDLQFPVFQLGHAVLNPLDLGQQGAVFLVRFDRRELAPGLRHAVPLGLGIQFQLIPFLLELLDLVLLFLQLGPFFLEPGPRGLYLFGDLGFQSFRFPDFPIGFLQFDQPFQLDVHGLLGVAPTRLVSVRSLVLWVF